MEEVKSEHFLHILSALEGDHGHMAQSIPAADCAADEPHKVWLRHVYVVLDSLVLNETFDNFMPMQQTDLMSQQYYVTLRAYSKRDLMKIVTNKLAYVRNKALF